MVCQNCDTSESVNSIPIGYVSYGIASAKEKKEEIDRSRNAPHRKNWCQQTKVWELAKIDFPVEVESPCGIIHSGTVFMNQWLL